MVNAIELRKPPPPFVSRDKKYTPNYVATNKGKFYFVMPESAKKQEQPK